MSTKPTAPDEKNTRVISPEIAALRAEHQGKVNALKAAQVSAATLKRITEYLLPKLTLDDKSELRKALDN